MTDDVLREAIAQALADSDASAHGTYTWGECGWELRDDYRRYATAILALPEAAALRAKAAAADRVRECIDDMDAIEVALGGLMYVHGEVRRALDGQP